MDETVAGALEVVESGGFAQHGAINAAKVVRFQHDEHLLAAVAQSEVITADGQSVVWAGRLLGLPIPERVTGIDLMQRLLQVADERGLRVYLLGARPDVVAAVADRLHREYPRAEIAGARHGYFGDDEEPAIVESIAEAQPHFLFVAIESPKKELFLARNRGAFGSCFAVGVGGTFDVLAGRVKRAPELAQRFNRGHQNDEHPFEGGMYTIESYLEYHGEKLGRRFDANTYIVLSRVMNYHDVGRGRGLRLPDGGHLHRPGRGREPD